MNHETKCGFKFLDRQLRISLRVDMLENAMACTALSAALLVAFPRGGWVLKNGWPEEKEDAVALASQFAKPSGH